MRVITDPAKIDHEEVRRLYEQCLGCEPIAKIHGACWLSWDDLERLLHEQGEACIPVARRRPA